MDALAGFALGIALGSVIILAAQRVRAWRERHKFDKDFIGWHSYGPDIDWHKISEWEFIERR